MAGKIKMVAEPEETQPEEPETGMVMIKANPLLAHGCEHQLVLRGASGTYTVGTMPIAVSAAEYRSLSLTEVRGVKAIIRA